MEHAVPAQGELTPPHRNEPKLTVALRNNPSKVPLNSCGGWKGQTNLFASHVDPVSNRVLRRDLNVRLGVLANQQSHILAAPAGLTDFLGDVRIRAIPAAWQHAIGNVIAVLISLLYWRYSHSADAVLPTGLECSLVVVAILLFTGWMGWEMVYRHRVAVYDQPGPQASAGS
jgi:hypothetical protein